MAISIATIAMQWPIRMGRRLDGFGYFSRTQTAGTNTDVFAHATNQNMHTLQVGTLNAFGFDIRVANSISNLSLFAANFTLSWHGFSGGGNH
jgi:hypothetical protein